MGEGDDESDGEGTGWWGHVVVLFCVVHRIVCPTWRFQVPDHEHFVVCVICQSRTRVHRVQDIPDTVAT